MSYAFAILLWLLMLTLVPQLIGHSMFNFTLGYLPATLISISTQTVVVTSSILAFFIFDEVPLPLQILGSAVIVTGVLLAIWGQAKAKRKRSTTPATIPDSPPAPAKGQTRESRPVA